MTTRCDWAGSDPLYLAYHDREWGVPVHNDRQLFEMLILEGAQAGLSWITILKKRENYRRAFDNFEPEKVAAYGEEKSFAFNTHSTSNQEVFSPFRARNDIILNLMAVESKSTPFKFTPEQLEPRRSRKRSKASNSSWPG